MIENRTQSGELSFWFKSDNHFYKHSELRIEKLGNSLFFKYLVTGRRSHSGELSIACKSDVLKEMCKSMNVKQIHNF